MLELGRTPAIIHRLPVTVRQRQNLHPAETGLMPTKCKDEHEGELLVKGFGQGHLAGIGRVDESQLNSIHDWKLLRNRVLAPPKFLF